MTSQALDLVTMGHALSELSATYLGDCQWQVTSGEQRQQQQGFLAWYMAHRDEIGKLSNLEALASTDYTKLNAFLVARGFDPLFDPFPGVGVASVLDMLVNWLHKGTLTTIERYDTATRRPAIYPAFVLPAAGVELFDVMGFNQPLGRLLTKTGESLWLMKADEPSSGIVLANLAHEILSADRKLTSEWTVGAAVPMLEMSLEPDISWMVGMETSNRAGQSFVIEQAFQQFKLRANEKGARVKVATGFGFECTSFGPDPYIFDDPFVGFFTQQGHDALPMAAFYADTDSWRNTGGTLEEL